MYISTTMSNETLDKIESNGGYAIVISYDKTGNSDYWDTYWYVGFGVSASIKSGGIRYEITKHSGDETHVTSDLTLDEAVEYTTINFS